MTNKGSAVPGSDRELVLTQIIDPMCEKVVMEWT